jgi:hypothetical protein
MIPHPGRRGCVRLVAAITATVLLLGVPGLTAHAAEPQRVKVLVNSHEGFDPPIVTVTQGEPVEIAFVYDDHDLDEDNPHVIFIEGLDLQTEEISRENPEAVLRLVADTSGRMTIRCTRYCTGHERLLAGYLDVRPSGGDGQATVEATQVELAVGTHDVADAPLVLRATVTTTAGDPIEGVMVRFEQETDLVDFAKFQFLWVAVGAARTDEEGAAGLEYSAFGTSSEPLVRAVFDGTSRYLPATGTAELSLSPLGAAPAEEAGLHVPVMGFWLIWVVLASVWLTFGYVLMQVLGIREGGTGNETPALGSVPDAWQTGGHGMRRSRVLSRAWIPVILAAFAALVAFPGVAPSNLVPIAGIVVGVLGLVLGGILAFRGRGGRPAPGDPLEVEHLTGETRQAKPAKELMSR